MKTFDLKSFLTNNREMVIAQFENLTKEKLYNGISLRDFMVQVYQSMAVNNFKSEAKASKEFPFILGNVYVSQLTVDTGYDADKRRADKYKGTAYMSMV